MAKNYEKLYNDLKAEYDEAKMYNDELCQEYESTIQLQTESIDKLKEEKKNMENKISQLEKEIKNNEKEKETLRDRNKDKILDIQNLSQANEKLKGELRKIKEEKDLIKSKIITLENENDHFQNQIRQNEARIEDLNNQLESTLEENITLQTEFDLYKQQNEEALLRKEQELKDIQNDILNKEKIIQRLNDKRESLKDLKLKMQISIDKKYKKTNSICGIGEKNEKEKDELKLGKSLTINDDTKLLTPLSNSAMKYPSKFMEIYRKSLNGEIKKNFKNETKNELKNEKNIKNCENSEKDDEKIDDNDSDNLDKKFFEDLVICDEKDFNINPIKEKNIKKSQMVKHLNNMLNLIQNRKNIMINRQKLFIKYIEKMGLKF